MTQKTILVLVAVLVAGGAVLFMMRGSRSSSESQAMPSSPQNTEQAGTPTAGGASGAVDEFSAQMDAELQASASAVAELDAGDNTSVSDIQAAGANSNLYDPNNI